MTDAGFWNSYAPISTVPPPMREFPSISKSLELPHSIPR